MNQRRICTTLFSRDMINTEIIDIFSIFLPIIFLLSKGLILLNIYHMLTIGNFQQYVANV